MTKTAIVHFPLSLPSIQATALFGRYGLTIWSGGFVGFSSAPTNHVHMHESYHELCLVIDGSGRFRHGQKIFELSAGSIFFSEKNTAHEISSFRTRNLSLVFMNLAISETPAPLSTNPFDATIHRFLLGHSIHRDGCADMLSYINVICNGEATLFDRVRREEAAKLLVLDALDRLSIQKSAAADADTGGSHDMVSRAIAFIERGYSRPIAVGEIAAACGCSERHLRRLFTAKTGKSILEVVNERKITLAAQQLLMRFTVTQVAESLQMSSIAHFSRLFKRYHGMSPKEYQTANAPRPVFPRTSFNTHARGPVRSKPAE